MMAQSLPGFGRVRIVPPSATARLEFRVAAPVENLGVRCHVGFVANDDGRTSMAALTPGGSPVAGRLRRRWPLNASRHRRAAASPPRGMPCLVIRPAGTPVEVVQLQPRRSIDGGPKRAISMRIA